MATKTDQDNVRLSSPWTADKPKISVAGSALNNANQDSNIKPRSLATYESVITVVGDNKQNYGELVNKDDSTRDFDRFEISVFKKQHRAHTKEVSGIVRRDKFLRDLVTNSVSSRTNFVNKKELYESNNSRLGPLKHADLQDDTVQQKN